MIGAEALVPPATMNQRIIDTRAGGIGRRHHHGEHIPSAQRFTGERCHDRGIDAARQTQDGLGKPVLARIIVNPEHQRAANSFNVVSRQTTLVCNSALKIHGAKKLFEGRRL